MRRLLYCSLCLLYYLLYPAGWLVSKVRGLAWDLERRRVNRYLRLRQAGRDRAAALRQARLDPAGAVRFLTRLRAGLLGEVGVLGYDGVRFQGMDFRQLAVVLGVHADLAPLLDAGQVAALRAELTRLRDHNWGGVRRAAAAALATLDGPPENVAAAP